LPNCDNAIVTKSKIVDYLLSLNHPDGRSKALFFGRFGFRSEEWQTLAEALKDVARRNEVASVAQSPWGRRFVVDGALDTPDGRQPRVRTVWILENNAPAPRLITAHPL
jgi:hypothetical protein